MGVKGGNDVGKGFSPYDSILCERMLRDIPMRAVQLTQP